MRGRYKVWIDAAHLPAYQYHYVYENSSIKMGVSIGIGPMEFG